MLAKERQDVIMDILRAQNIIKITEIVERFDVSNETARRDLEALQSAKLVKRIHGGAMLPDPERTQSQYAKRKSVGYNEKKAIGKLAASLIQEGDVIMLGNGTTVVEIARNIKHINNLTVLTACIPVMNELLVPNIRLVALGGVVDPNECCMYGDLTEDCMRRFFVDKTFIGAGGITLDGGVTDYGTTSNTTFLTHAGKITVVADSAKFGSNAFRLICPLKNIHTIVSDTFLDEQYRQELQSLGAQLLLADSYGM